MTVSLPVIFAALVVALCGINRVEKHVKQFRANVKAAIDEQ
jgi:hypothetical protein